MEIRNEDFEGMTMSKQEMINCFNAHGMNNNDYQDFVEQYGYEGPYKITEIRSFLGYYGGLMSYIKTVNLKPSEAKELIHLGFILKLVKLGYMTDTYHVYAMSK